jgi:hypothetical protein
LAERDRGRDGHDPAIVRFDQLPVAFMHHPVMPVAQKREIVEIGRPTMDPVHEMMPITP